MPATTARRDFDGCAGGGADEIFAFFTGKYGGWMDMSNQSGKGNNSKDPFWSAILQHIQSKAPLGAGAYGVRAMANKLDLLSDAQKVDLFKTL